MADRLQSREVKTTVLVDGVEKHSMEKPLLDDRAYRVILLPNKLEALLVHDADTDKASAAMDVDVGSLMDAEDMPGMAHAVEHLLFMGTEKYPHENDYNAYLAKYGGMSNAFTASTSTNYYFELSASSTSNSTRSSAQTSTSSLPVPKSKAPLYGALDRFAQFFIKPLFLEDTLDRELKAVDSENKKNLQSDDWRLHQLNKSTSSKEHPFHKFSTGNYKVLHDDPIARGVTIRDAFIDFYQRNYSANRMKLVVLGRESLDELQSWVEEFFAAVPNQDLIKNRWDGLEAYGPDELCTQIFVKPVMDMREIELYFPYPDEEDLYASRPSSYISHLVGHEGPGSLYEYIKGKGWANGLSAGSRPTCPGLSFFSITIRLTEEGLKHYQDIIKHTFQYIALLKEDPPYEWIVDEMAKIAEFDFKYMQKAPASRTTSRLGGVMQKPLPRDKLLSGQLLISEFKPDAIKQGLEALRPDNFRYVLVSKTFPGDWPLKEKWYGTEYKYEKISKEFLDELDATVTELASSRPRELHLPARNEFVPQRLDVDKKQVDEPLPAPKLIRNDDNVRVWFKKDDRFWVPKANINFSLRSPLAYVSPLTTVMGSLYTDLVNDKLSDYSYNAELAGLQYNLSVHSFGMDIGLNGYNDKMSVLLDKVLTSMRDLDIKDDRFEIIKERKLRGYKNFEYQEPYRQIGTFSRWLVSERAWAMHQFLDVLPSITAADVRSFYPQLLRQLHIEVLVHGNLYKEDALNVANMIERTLKPKALPSSQWPTRRFVEVPTGSDFRYERTLANPDNINHCIDYHIRIGSGLDRTTRAMLLLVGQIADEPCFDILRSKEQLGYVVSGGVVNFGVSGLSGYRVLIQSERDCAYLETRIEAFLKHMQGVITDMKPDEFEAHKIGLINKKLQKLKNLSEETGRFWLHITDEALDFELSRLDAEHVEGLTKTQIADFYNKFFLPSSSSFTKSAVWLVAQSSASDLAAKLDPQEQRKQLIDTLAALLTQVGLQVDRAALAAKLDGVDLSLDAVLAAVSSYLSETAGVAQEQAEQMREHGRAVLGPALAQLGIGASAAPTAATEDAAEPEKVAPDGDAAGDEETRRRTVVIEDVRAFKASMPLSAGPKPVKDLGEFEEIESKL